MTNSYTPQTSGDSIGNMGVVQDPQNPQWIAFLRRRGMSHSDFLVGDAKAQKNIEDQYPTFLNNRKLERDLNTIPENPSKDLADLFATMTASQERMSDKEIAAENKRFEDALKYSREGAKTKMLMQIPGQLTDMARMPGAIALTAAQEQAKNTQDFIRSLSLMDNIETIKPGDIPNRKYFG